MIRVLTFVLLLAACTVTFADDPASQWQTLFNGKTLGGWKANEHPESWKVENGLLVFRGERSHLFYIGADEPFRDFELECDAMTTPGSNSGISFHTRYQETGWLRYGIECQINVSHADPIKSGSLFKVVDLPDRGLRDHEWNRYSIRVEGKRIITRVNGELFVDYTEPNGKEPGKTLDRRLGEGTFALQGHDPKSKVYFRNIRVRRLQVSGESHDSKTDLDLARQDFHEQVKGAIASINSQFDSQIEAARKRSDSGAIEILQKQQERLTYAHVLPSVIATAKFEKDLSKAMVTVDKAYQKAISECLRNKDADRASALKAELNLLVSGYQFDGRRHYLREGDVHYVIQPDGSWLAGRKDRDNRFTEEGRTAEYIQLKDTTTDGHLRLYNDRISLKNGYYPWAHFKKGRWIP